MLYPNRALASPPDPTKDSTLAVPALPACHTSVRRSGLARASSWVGAPSSTLPSHRPVRAPLCAEPKIKWYAEMCGPSRSEVEVRLQRLVDAIIEDMLQPDVNGLERRK